MHLTTETKVLIGGIVATVLIIVGGAYFMGSRQSGTVGEPVAEIDRLVREDDPALGPPDALVTVVEFGDFQCPACGALHPVLRQIKEANAKGSVRFVYRHFPLPQHEFAPLAAEASVAAQQQGKFWEYHDLLFENQSSLERADLERYAEQLGFNMDEFRKALDGHTYQDAVRQDVSDGTAVGVNSTPTLYINGVRYTGQYSIDALRAAIDQAQSQQ